MINIGLCGASGRMGREIQAVVGELKNAQVSLALSSTSVPSDSELKSVDVWIDFSLPEAQKKNIDLFRKLQKPVVSGVTGLDDLQMQDLHQLSQAVPVLWASNMSMGVAVLNEALKVFASVKDFDFQIEEFHHNKKKDKPSGTAKTLKENLDRVIEKSSPDPLAIRGGGIFGVHKVYAMSDEEVITFEHSALNRKVFAKGAVKAALWLTQQKAGFYSVRDMLFND